MLVTVGKQRERRQFCMILTFLFVSTFLFIHFFLYFLFCVSSAKCKKLSIFIMEDCFLCHVSVDDSIDLILKLK